MKAVTHSRILRNFAFLLVFSLFPAFVATAQTPSPNAAKPDAAKPADDKGNAAKADAAKDNAAKADAAKDNAAKADAAKDNAAKDNAAKTSVTAEARPYVDAIQAYYDNAKTYSATFEQKYETVDGVSKTSTGVVWFKKPGKMRWDYETPEARFLISDGNYFWSWEPVYRQYCKQDLKAAQLPTALTFLAGGARIEDDFYVSLKKVNGNQVQLELKPHKASLAYELIIFEILMPTGKVYRATIYDAMGNTNRITFKSPEINGALEDSSFQFVPPADARHICE